MSMNEVKNLIVIEGDLEMRSLLYDFLTSDGYNVYCFPSARQAIQELRGPRFSAGPAIDLVISDLELPDMRSAKLIAEVRKDRPGLPVALISVNGGAAYAEKARKLGAQALLVKPFLLSAVSATIKALLASA